MGHWRPKQYGLRDISIHLKLKSKKSQPSPRGCMLSAMRFPGVFS